MPQCHVRFSGNVRFNLKRRKNDATESTLRKFRFHYGPERLLGGGRFCDIKRLGTGKGSNKGPKRDLRTVVSEVPATVAGMFTTTKFAPPRSKSVCPA